MIGTIIGTVIAGEAPEQTGASSIPAIQTLNLSGTVINRLELTGYIDING